MRDYARSSSSPSKHLASFFTTQTLFAFVAGALLGSFLTVFVVQSPNVSIKNWLPTQRTLHPTKSAKKIDKKASHEASAKPATPRFDFYTMLPQEKSRSQPAPVEQAHPTTVRPIEKKAPVVTATVKKTQSTLQLAAFRKQCDADSAARQTFAFRL